MSGGVTHDFPALNAEVSHLLDEVGFDVTVREDVLPALDDLDGVDLLVVNMLRWRMDVERYLDRRAEFGIEVDPATQRDVEAWVYAGGGVLALHAASICFDGWPGWRDLVGARWDWETSHHPPLGPVEVTVHPERHPVVAGLPSSFTVDDEVYGFLDEADDVVPLATATHSGRDHPLVWARTIGAGRVVHDTLGHHVPTYRNEVQRRIVQRGALWVIGRSDSELAAL
ncbi:ThuA domain-containing protein [Jatrophihabitans sp. YIM 134969]